MGKKKFKKKKYLEKAGTLCPYCGSDDLDTEPVQTDGGIAWQNVCCGYCGSEWRDLYKLIGAEEIHNNT